MSLGRGNYTSELGQEWGLDTTYFDLNQVRADIFDFFQQHLGYTVLAFEHNSFPIDPDSKAIENCRKRVEHQADVLILIVGGRYGYVETNSGKSVTNLEYLAAKAKRIPIYVFVESDILVLYETWRKNPENKFDGAIDNPKLLEFIRILREDHQVWMTPFGKAQEVVTTLRCQFAFLLHDALQERRRLDEHGSRDHLQGLSGRAYRIALEQPRGWEHRLFSQLLNDELENRASERRDYGEGFAVGFGAHVDFNTNWTLERISELQRVSAWLESLINKDFAEAIGAPGKSGDIVKLRDLSRRFGEIYRFAMSWTNEIRRAHFPSVLKETKSALCKFSTDFILTIEKLALEFSKVLDGIEDKLARGESVKLSLHFDLKLHGIDEFTQSLDLALDRIRNGEVDPI